MVRGRGPPVAAACVARGAAPNLWHSYGIAATLRPGISISAHILLTPMLTEKAAALSRLADGLTQQCHSAKGAHASSLLLLIKQSDVLPDRPWYSCLAVTFADQAVM